MLWHIVVTISNGWVVGDWLINYSDGGFKRRGLSGSFFFLLQDITKLDLKLLLFGFISIIYALFYFLFYLLLRRKRITLLYAVMFLLPVTFFFYIYNPECVGRKEVLLFLLSVLYIYIMEKDLVRNKIVFGVFLALVFFFTLFHEIIFFLIPFFLFFTYCHNKQHNKVFNYKPALFIFLSSFLPMLLILGFGGELNQGQSLPIFLKRGLDDRVMGGILLQGNIDVMASIKQFSYGGYFIPFILSLVPVIIFIRQSKQRDTIFYKRIRKGKKKAVNVFDYKLLLIVITLLMVFGIPLFLSAIDWGRWISIYFIMTLIACYFFLEHDNAEDVNTDNLVLLRNFVSVKSIAILLLCLVFVFSWRMPQCCGTGIILDGKDLLFFHSYFTEYAVFPARNLN
jgi:hypothetical protein